MNVLEKILEEIKKLKCNQDSENQDYITGYMSALSTVEGIIAEENDGWIPVEERLPDKSGAYIVTARDGDLAHVTFCKWQTRYKRWDLTGSRAYWKVIAWQPLLEAYHPKQAPTAEHIMSRFMKAE